MYCQFCGNKLEDNPNATYCPVCGNKVKGTPAVTTTQSSYRITAQYPQESNPNPALKSAIIGFVFSFAFSLVGLIISAIALKKYKLQKNQNARGLAVAGLTISIISVAFYSLYVLIILSVLL